MDDVRLIDANALKEKMTVGALGGHLRIWVCGVIDDAPTVNAVPVKRGKWDREDGEYGGYVLCSECGLNLDVSDYEKQEWREILRFCPSCGADMREVTDADS